ncbi:MAG: hypothetical protein P1U38_11505 [Aeromicrobium sp.]|uniref:hypothetical protein n=1 Tax=Aeromicrobium sp. TaxID=1871063 RepID=UPI00261828B2|nr:hypothetical protein [Aeromicrobium sp.]MDF1705391.1 hypothetical protein [Aeromicrobium sp.]
MTRRFDGHIVGLGTTSGTRVVVGIWERSPHGPFADAMVERPDGHRILLAPDAWVADLVATTYRFDEVQVVAVALDGWSIQAGPLQARWTPGARAPIGWLLRCVPRPVAHHETWARLCDPVARRVMPGVRTHGTAGQGRTEWYAATDAWQVTSATVSWDGQDLGPLAPVDPPVRFGFASAPRTPTLSRVTSFIRDRP